MAEGPSSWATLDEPAPAPLAVAARAVAREAVVADQGDPGPASHWLRCCLTQAAWGGEVAERLQVEGEDPATTEAERRLLVGSYRRELVALAARMAVLIFHIDHEQPEGMRRYGDVDAVPVAALQVARRRVPPPELSAGPADLAATGWRRQLAQLARVSELLLRGQWAAARDRLEATLADLLVGVRRADAHLSRRR